MLNSKLRSAPRLKTTPAPKQVNRSPSVRTRIPSSEREALILAEAVRFFAEFGFAGDTRELASRAHVTHPLLFKYFSTKEALIERVYETVYLERWRPEWDKLIKDRSIPLRERMTRFYVSFSDVVLNREWIRLFMFFGLRGADINERWFTIVRDRVVHPLCVEIRHELGLPEEKAAPIMRVELELVQGISTRIFSWGLRDHVYGMPWPNDGDVPALIKAEIDVLFDGVGPTLERLFLRPGRSRTAAQPPRAGVPPLRKNAAKPKH